MGHQITLTLSDSVYEALRYQAQAQKKSVKQVAEETLRAATLPEKSLQRPLA
jgi:predicted HicB family RNase H-like nuclease